jgi:hypothetical protein
VIKYRPFLLHCICLLMALTAVRCGAQNSVAIGATTDITGLEAAGGSIENDPTRTLAGQICCAAQQASPC